jgi:N-acyl-phosphatidylethanolamine-hydrolysing phospholipase D
MVWRFAPLAARLAALACLVGGAGWIGCAYPADSGPDPGQIAAVPDSLLAPHGSRGSFFNPWERDRKSVWRLLRWQLLSRNPYASQKGDPDVPRMPNDGRYLAGVEHSATATWVGHATFAVHDRDDVFLTDPHFGKRALIPARVVPPGIPLESVPPDAFAVISHNHYDHLDEFTVETLPASVGWYVPLGMAEWFLARGREDVTELDWWESAQRGRWTITCLPLQHWSRRGLGDTNESLWCAWLLDSQDYTYFFAGDTGYFHGFEEYGRRYGPIDVAMLPIGAYEPRWIMRYQHMNPAEAVQAFHDLRAHTMLPMHWGTFDLTDEPLDLPPRVLAQVVEERGEDPERVRTLAVGERWKVEGHPRKEQF